MTDGNRITLGNRRYPYREPVLRDLRLVISHYNAIAGSDDPGRHIDAILGLLVVGNAPKARRLGPAVLADFLAALPGKLGLEQGPDVGDGPAVWGGLYAHLSMTLGWTYDYIDGHMTLSRLKEMQPYLRKNPATHQLVAAFLGYEPDPTPEEKVRNLFNKFRAMLGRRG